MLLWVLILTLFGAVWRSRGTPCRRACGRNALAVQAAITSRVSAVHPVDLQPLRAADPGAAGGQRPQPAAAGPRPRDPSAAALPGLCRLFDRLLLRGSRADRGAHRCRLGPRRAALDAGRLGFLTLGIAMGSYWAYYELGWGGWWFWDPVENASLMPWLAGTALLHSTVVMEKRDALKVWTILLAILTFSLSLIGTFLVRSGVLTSVHAFATRPDAGRLHPRASSCCSSAARSRCSRGVRRCCGRAACSRRCRARARSSLNNLFLATACATVFIGTLYPLALEALTGEKISVGAPFFNLTFVPARRSAAAAGASRPDARLEAGRPSGCGAAPLR